jgi:hypothetical protein
MTAASFSSTSVGTTAVEIAAWTRSEVPFQVRVYLPGGDQIYLGSTSSVTATTGYRLDSAQTFTMAVPAAKRGEAPQSEHLYAIGSGSSRIHVAIDPS